MKTRFSKFISLRYVVFKSLAWVAAAIFVAILCRYSSIEELLFSPEFHIFDDVSLEEFVISLVLLLPAAARLAYLLTYRSLFQVASTAQGVRITRGVIWRTQVLIPYSKISEVNIEHNVMHLVLGLRYVRILVTGTLDEKNRMQYHLVEGLSRRNALRIYGMIQRHLATPRQGQKRQKNSRILNTRSYGSQETAEFTCH